MNTNPMPLFVVLGAPDHEMQEIERICREENILHAYATVRGHIVKSYDAYDATGLTRLLPKEPVHTVMVECNVRHLACDTVIDHHNEGDPGYGKLPHEYLEGSSLGQFLALIGMSPSPQQRVIAAADHCLTAAYQGRCPEVSPEDLRAFRERTRSAARALPLDELRKQVEAARKSLKMAPTILVDDVELAFFDREPPPETSEASARDARPYAYIKLQEDGRYKSGIRSAPPETVAFWMANCGLNKTYGDPARGFAGGYFA
jgi:hypothetical protein